METSFAPGEFAELPNRLRALSVYSDAHASGAPDLDDDDATLGAMQSPRSIMSDEARRRRRLLPPSSPPPHQAAKGWPLRDFDWSQVWH